MDQPLLGLWDRIDAGPPPLAEVSATGARVRRRRRLWAAAAAVAVVAVVAAGALARGPLLGDRAADPPSGSLPAPPDGMRWVGMGRVVVAVPESWTTGGTRCLVPIEDTVYFDSHSLFYCPDAPDTTTVRDVSTLAILDSTAGYGEYQLHSMRSIGEVDGREVLEREDCEGWFEGVCRRLFAMPAEGVVFAVTIAERGDGDYEQIRDSLHVLPEGLTTVPLATPTPTGETPARGASPNETDAYVRVLRDSGLQVDMVTAAADAGETSALVTDLPAGSLLGVDPQPGSVIDVGGTVTVTVAGRPSRAP